jgi:hypothetical protein
MFPRLFNAFETPRVVGIGVRLGQLTIDGQRFLTGVARLVVTLLLAVKDAEVIQRHRQVRSMGIGVRLGQLTIDGQRFLGGVARLVVAVLMAVQDAQVV